mmetsp:Transcript_21887/g.33976  ORF Transcript_21887/g.33976 Transcript_21887/m.33976 type:complete len:81 (+) Transcript_21887:2821-3063(+)
MSRAEAFEKANELFKNKEKSTGSGWLVSGKKELAQYWYAGETDRSFLSNLGEWMSTNCSGFQALHPDDTALGFAPKYKST